MLVILVLAYKSFRWNVLYRLIRYPRCGG